MRHYKKGRKLGTSASHTKAMKKSIAVALFTNDRIKTTDTRAKEVRGLVDKIITWAKKGDLHSRRLAIAALGDAELVRETFEKASQGMWKDRNGGYTRILKLGPRKGDNAPMVILELVSESATKKKDNKSVTKKATKKSSDAKKDTKKADKKSDADADEESDTKKDDSSDLAADAKKDTDKATNEAKDAEKEDAKEDNDVKDTEDGAAEDKAADADEKADDASKEDETSQEDNKSEKEAE